MEILWPITARLSILGRLLSNLINTGWKKFFHNNCLHSRMSLWQKNCVILDISNGVRSNSLVFDITIYEQIVFLPSTIQIPQLLFSLESRTSDHNILQRCTNQYRWQDIMYLNFWNSDRILLKKNIMMYEILDYKYYYEQKLFL